MRSAPLGRPVRGVVCLVAARGRGSTAWREYSGAADVPGTAIAPARVGSAEPGTGRMTEGGPQVNSIARGCQNLVRPHRDAVSPTKCYPKCSGLGVRPPQGSLP